jgi:hypothetical protein
MTQEQIAHAMGTVSFKFSKLVKSTGDSQFDLVRSTASAWDPDGKADPKKPNSFVAIPIGDSGEEFRHTLRRNMYTSGMGDVESFDVEYRIVNVVHKKSGTTAEGSDTGSMVLSFAEKKALFIELGDEKGLTALLRVAGLTAAEAKRNAPALIAKG